MTTGDPPNRAAVTVFATRAKRNRAIVRGRTSRRRPGSAIVYGVTAVVAGTESLRAEDVAAMFTFTDYPLVAQSTPIRAAHITVLQNAVNAVRARAGMGAVTLPSIIPLMTVQATHVQGLLDPLDDARQPLGLARLFDQTSVAAGSVIRADVLNAIRESM
jgi:hypothetical protein